MKTAEDWDKEFSRQYNAKTHPEWDTKSTFDLFDDMCCKIQLDAFKAGAEWAAKIAEAESDKVSHEDPFAHQEIRSALEQLTEIPKN